MLANRMHRFSGSPTSALIAKVAQLRKEGKQIISLNVGEPDFGTPDYIKTAGIKAIVDNFTKYTPGAGILELRQEICKKLKTENNLTYTPNEVCVTVGAKQAIFNAIMATVDQGDEVILPVPCWVSYADMVKIAGATPVFVGVKEKEGFALDIAAIKKAITPKTRAIVICSPNNPSGAVYSELALRKLANLACEHDFWIIADEIYEKLIYDGQRHVSIASFSQAVWQRTITVNGFSKAYAMTGWRIGYAAGCKEVIDAMKALQSQMTSATSSIAQKAAAAALFGPQHDLEVMVEAFDKRRSYVHGRLNNISGISCDMPKGAFYMMPDVSSYFLKAHQGKTITNAVDLSDYLLEQACVAVVPGEAFFTTGKIRISYSNSMENLSKALDQIETALKMLQ
ncbi:MAG: pyridoxal phosphate-dependent aminotransferase [Candidatus Fimivivens sp.]